MPVSVESRRIRSLRPPKPEVDPWHPIGAVLESERLSGGGQARVLTVFLAGRECPFTCVFCDLWRFTTDAPTPPGAIPAQIAEAVGRFTGELGAGELDAGVQVKLYNASNFFDPRAVPPEDDPAILRQVERFARVVVECHPRLVGRRCLELGARLEGRLQVAMGLETVHPEALPRLGKQATLDDFRRAAERLAENSIGLRAFVLLGAPFVPPQEAVAWAERSARFALAHGADHVTLIPTRGGNGEMERLKRQGLFTDPTLEQVEEAQERCLLLEHSLVMERDTRLGAGVVTVDTWDLDRLAACPDCRDERRARLARINLSGEAEPRVPCGCRGGIRR